MDKSGLSEKQKSEIIELYKNNNPVVKIAKIYKVNPQTIKLILTKAEIYRYKKFDKIDYSLIYIGAEFNNLIVVGEILRERGKAVRVLCKCSCGRELLVTARCLIKLDQKSCKKCSSAMIVHGRSKTRLYKIFTGMHQRCYNKQSEAYHWYGGRGITICDEWLTDRQNFMTWALENGYEDHLTIDRKNSNGNYCPNNCRWITSVQNSYNTRVKSTYYSKYKGVCWDKSRNKWIVHIMKNRKSIFLGRYEDEEQAAIVYDTKAKELFGEFAYLNFPGE